MTRRTQPLAWILLGFSILALSATANAQDTRLSIEATIAQIIRPDSAEEQDGLNAGTRVTGIIVLSESESERRLLTGDGKKLQWLSAVKTLELGAPFEVKFIGGNMSIQDGLFKLSANQGYCLNCSGEGKPIRLVRKSGSDQVSEQSFLPARYMLMMPNDEISGSSPFDVVIGKVAALGKESKSKLMLMYSKSGAASRGEAAIEGVRVILDIVAIDLQ